MKNYLHIIRKNDLAWNKIGVFYFEMFLCFKNCRAANDFVLKNNLINNNEYSFSIDEDDQAIIYVNFIHKEFEIAANVSDLFFKYRNLFSDDIKKDIVTNNALEQVQFYCESYKNIFFSYYKANIERINNIKAISNKIHCKIIKYDYFYKREIQHSFEKKLLQEVTNGRILHKNYLKYGFFNPEKEIESNKTLIILSELYRKSTDLEKYQSFCLINTLFYSLLNYSLRIKFKAIPFYFQVENQDGSLLMEGFCDSLDDLKKQLFTKTDENENLFLNDYLVFYIYIDKLLISSPEWFENKEYIFSLSTHNKTIKIIGKKVLFTFKNNKLKAINTFSIKNYKFNPNEFYFSRGQLLEFRELILRFYYNNNYLSPKDIYDEFYCILETLFYLASKNGDKVIKLV